MAELVQPRYDILGPRIGAYGSSAPGFQEEAEANWRLSVGPQLARRVYSDSAPVDTNYNPWDHLEGYEGYADVLTLARSAERMALMKSHIDQNLRDRETVAQGDWGLVAGFVGGMFDPVNYIPIPGATGIGFVRGAARGAASNIAMTAVTEPLRIGVADPTAEWSELQYSVGMAGLLGAGLGGIAGSFRLRGVRAAESGRSFNELLEQMSREDGGMNTAREFDIAGQNINRTFGHTGSYDETGAYNPVTLADLDTPVRSKVGPDGQNYFYDDQRGWVLQADKGIDSPRAVSQDILDGLGSPEMVPERKMVVDDYTLRDEFERKRWQEDKPNGRKGMAPDSFRDADEFINFRQREAVWSRLLTQNPGETVADFANRVQEAALNDLKASRVSATVARTGVLARFLEATNRSPVANAARVFRDDNVLTDLVLGVAGDYGWMTEANRVGVATPPSVLLHALRHNAVRADMRRELDIQFLRFATGNSRIEGRTFLGQNMSATAARAGARIAKMRGQNVMTFTDFKEMAGRAVFDLDPFEVNGFPVVPEAREVADAWKRIAEKYDAVQRDLGMYRDQNGLRSTVQKADNRLLRLRDQMARFLWKTPGLNERTTPSSLRAAVRVGERVFTGETHDEAMMAVIDQFGPEGSRMVGELPPEAFGWSVTDARKLPDAPFGGVPLTTRLQDANGDPLPLNHGTGSWFSRFAKEMRGSNTEAKDAFDGVFFATNPDFAEGFAGAEGGRVIKAFGDAANPVEYLPGEYGGFFEGGRWSDLIAEARREGNDAVIFKDYEFAGGKTDIVVMLDENNIFVDGESFVGLTAKEAEFRTFEQTVADRVETLSEGARAVYEDMSQQLARLEAEHSGAKQALDTLRDKPHRFVDQQGRTEGYFTRYYHKPKIMEARAKFTRLIKHIFSKDNPAGAAERAEAFVDDLLGLSDNADEGPVAATGMRHLNERKIDVPNSFRVDDPEYGELRLSDFIETDIEVISDTYIRRAGARIEMTRAYGDPQMWDKLHEAEMHWREKNLTPDMTPAQIKAARAEWDEYKGWVELARDDVLGTLKTADPWRMDNKWARRLSNTANLTLLGSVIKSVPPELVRNPMVNGWGTAFKAIFTDWFRDLDELKLDRATRLETGELVDMMLTTAGSQLHEINTADVRAGSSFDRGLNNLQNPFFKANGLTPWTTWQKTAVH
jgi:hypothetical protein